MVTDIKAGDTVTVVTDRARFRLGSTTLNMRVPDLKRGDVGVVQAVRENGDLSVRCAHRHRPYLVRPEEVEKVEDANSQPGTNLAETGLRVGQRVRATLVIEGTLTGLHDGHGTFKIDDTWHDRIGWSFEVLAEPTPPLPATPDSKIRHNDGGNDAVLFRDEWRWLNNGDVAYPAEWVGGFTVVRDAGADQ